MSTTSTNANPIKAATSAWRAKLEQLDAWYDVWCQTEEAKILSVFATAVLVFITAVVLFGYPAIIITALTMVPVVFTVLMLITVGK